MPLPRFKLVIGNRKQRASTDQGTRFLFSRELVHAKVLAFVLADETASPTIELSHLLGGLYLAWSERLRDYWGDRESFEEFFRTECRIDEPSWFYFIRAYESLYRRKRSSPIHKRMQQSQELSDAYAHAAWSLKSAGNSSDDVMPVLLAEDLLLAVATGERSDIAEKLVQSGLNLQALEEARRVRRRTVP